MKKILTVSFFLMAIGVVAQSNQNLQEPSYSELPQNNNVYRPTDDMNYKMKKVKTEVQKKNEIEKKDIQREEALEDENMLDHYEDSKRDHLKHTN